MVKIANNLYNDIPTIVSPVSSITKNNNIEMRVTFVWVCQALTEKRKEK